VSGVVGAVPLYILEGAYAFEEIISVVALAVQKAVQTPEHVEAASSSLMRDVWLTLPFFLTL